MRYLFNHAWKIMGVLAVLFALSLTACTEYNVEQSSDGSGNNCFTPAEAGEDIKSGQVDCSNETDNSVENPAPVVVE